jgi:hypothetical protein
MGDEVVEALKVGRPLIDSGSCRGLLPVLWEHAAPLRFVGGGYRKIQRSLARGQVTRYGPGHGDGKRPLGERPARVGGADYERERPAGRRSAGDPARTRCESQAGWELAGAKRPRVARNSAVRKQVAATVELAERGRRERVPLSSAREMLIAACAAEAATSVPIRTSVPTSARRAYEPERELRDVVMVLSFPGRDALPILLPRAFCNMHPDPDYGTAIATAFNDWLAETWLGEHNHDRLFKGSITIAHQDPQAAARDRALGRASALCTGYDRLRCQGSVRAAAILFDL